MPASTPSPNDVQIETGKALKDAYTDAYVRSVADALAGALGDRDAFVADVLADGWPELELKARMLRLAAALDAHMPADFEAAVAALTPVAPGFGNLLGLFVPSFVQLRAERAGLFERGLEVIAGFTAASTGEFAVRPFLIADPARALRVMQPWTAHPSEHVRRLASEGTRPRLPWAMALPAFKADPRPLLPQLEALRDDPSEYVRRSVANNLNDIAKDHPGVVLEVAERWLDGASPERARLVKHALRTLLKQGEARALGLFGFGPAWAIAVEDLALGRAAVTIGALRQKAGPANQLEFAFTLRHTGGAALGRVRLEYAIHYMKANGRTAPKVYRIAEFDSPETARAITRTQNFVDLSTRTHHPGRHELAIHVNGVERARTAFDLETP